MVGVPDASARKYLRVLCALSAIRIVEAKEQQVPRLMYETYGQSIMQLCEW